MVPGKRFPPLRGNSSALNLTPSSQPPPNITHIEYTHIQSDVVMAKLLFFYLPAISLVSEMCPNRLKQHSSADSSRGLINYIVTKTVCALLWTL